MSIASSLLDDLTAIRRWSQNLPPIDIAEVDTINVIIGDGVNVIGTGIAAALRVDFNANITGSFLHEFDGTTGSIVLDIKKALYTGSSPSFSSIVASAPPTISSGRYAADTTLTGWTTAINRGEVLQFSVTSASTVKRILATLRIRRLEP